MEISRYKIIPNPKWAAYINLSTFFQQDQKEQVQMTSFIVSTVFHGGVLRVIQCTKRAQIKVLQYIR